MYNMRYLIIIIALLLGRPMMYAQTIGLCNFDTLYVEDNTTVIVKGDFINGHAEFENHGEFNLEGNLDNQVSISNEGSGVFRLIGVYAQIVNLLGEFKTYNLDIDNEEGGVFLGDKNLSVFGDLDFINGHFWTRDNNLIEFKPNAVYFGARDESHITGPAIKEGNTKFRFPIGKDRILRPLAIAETNSINSYQAEYFSDTYPTLSTDGSLESVSDAEYWSFDRIFGNNDPQITLVWNQNSFLDQPFLDLQIGYIQNTEGWTRVESSTELPEQFETDLTSVNDIPGYGFYTFATTQANTFIQDGLVGFELVKEGCNVRINWNTIERMGRVAAYSIERRRSPGREYESIFSTVSNNTQLMDEYTILDSDVEDNEIYHYRVVVIYDDGTLIASEARLIKVDCSPISLVVYPNPVFQNEIVTIAVNSDIATDLDINVVDVLGRVLESHTLEVMVGANIFELPNTLHYGAAEYFIWTPKEEHIPTIKFQVIR